MIRDFSVSCATSLAKLNDDNNTTEWLDKSIDQSIEE